MNLTRFFERLTREAPDASSGAAGGAAPVNPGLDGSNIPSGAAPAAPDLSFVGAEFLDGGTLKADAFREHYQGLLTEKQARDAVQVPDAYSFAKPADLDLGDLKLPEGVDLEVKADDPAFKPLFDELGGFLRENRLPQEAASKVSGLLAKYEAARFKQGYDAAVKDWETLGPTEAARDQRLATVKRAVESKLPEAEAKALLASAGSAGAVKALERLLGTGGVNSPAPNPPTAPDDPIARRYPHSPR